MVKSSRALPAWVPVGRQGYSSRFVYTDDGAPRTTTREEEREIEGVLTGAYAAQLGGLNAIVFTAGIGEHASIIREKIIEPLGFMNFALDAQANEKHSTLLSTPHSKPILMIPADEEAEIAYWVEKLNSSGFT